eukprot:gnl/Chilomastix_caulleri/948.p1 GENE.gnl/Chilomastix_caulleri/948~~gnl/Chilomastix_caulleri/948.p1  ORF type:complete len:225 (+),score=78.97 gnl/Chilomastix_caulleri/948:57-731(+)
MSAQLPLQEAFKDKKVILASTSPRRKELLKLFGFEFETVAPPFDEGSVDPSSLWSVEEYVIELAKGKLKSALDLPACKNADVVVASDTIVHLDGEILGKPGTHEKAFEYLDKLSGRNHNVLSGVAIAMKKTEIDPNDDDGEYSILTFSESTVVKMIDAPLSLLKAYANTDEPLDKAGAYAIQGIGGAHLIMGIEGDYSNVVGLPLCRLGMALREAVSTLWYKEE